MLPTKQGLGSCECPWLKLERGDQRPDKAIRQSWKSWLAQDYSSRHATPIRPESSASARKQPLVADGTETKACGRWTQKRGAPTQLVRSAGRFSWLNDNVQLTDGAPPVTPELP